MRSSMSWCFDRRVKCTYTFAKFDVRAKVQTHVYELSTTPQSGRLSAGEALMDLIIHMKSNSRSNCLINVVYFYAGVLIKRLIGTCLL